ncbi:hypothetical protein Aperf_G00000009607 [Anoplocephala perfoliata]
MILFNQCRFASNIVNAAKVANRLANVEFPIAVMKRCQRWKNAKEAAVNLAAAPRAEHVKVVYRGYPHPETEMDMAKGISTPYDCAKHLSQMFCDKSVIAIVNGVPYDMHRPLTSDATLDFVHFKDIYVDPTEANFAFWRSGQLLMAAAVESAFDEKFQTHLLAFPTTPLESGSFVADFRMELKTTEEFEKMISWSPSENDLRAISQVGQIISANAHPIECLDFQYEDALKILEDDYRMLRLSEESNSKTHTLYRLGNYVQAHPGGPMITNTSLIGRFSVSSFRLLGGLSPSATKSNESPLQLVYRAQGICLPSAFLTHFTTYDVLLRRAKQHNKSAGEKPDYVKPL